MQIHNVTPLSVNNLYHASHQELNNNEKQTARYLCNSQNLYFDLHVIPTASPTPGAPPAGMVSYHNVQPAKAAAFDVFPRCLFP